MISVSLGIYSNKFADNKIEYMRIITIHISFTFSPYVNGSKPSSKCRKRLVPRFIDKAPTNIQPNSYNLTS